MKSAMKKNKDKEELRRPGSGDTLVEMTGGVLREEVTLEPRPEGGEEGFCENKVFQAEEAVSVKGLR